MAEAIDTRRPATYEDIRELKAELRAIGRRLDAIEERLPAQRASPPKRTPAKRAPARRKKPQRELMPGRRVLITGVGSHLGAELAARLERDPAWSSWRASTRGRRGSRSSGPS